MKYSAAPHQPFACHSQIMTQEVSRPISGCCPAMVSDNPFFNFLMVFFKLFFVFFIDHFFSFFLKSYQTFLTSVDSLLSSIFNTDKPTGLHENCEPPERRWFLVQFRSKKAVPRWMKSVSPLFWKVRLIFVERTIHFLLQGTSSVQKMVDQAAAPPYRHRHDGASGVKIRSR